MGRMLDALKNLEAEGGATLQVPVPVVASPAVNPVASTSTPKAAASTPSQQPGRTGTSSGANILATLAGAASSDAVLATSVPVSPTAPHPTSISSAAATLARLKASVPAARPNVAAAPASAGLPAMSAAPPTNAPVMPLPPAIAAQVVAEASPAPTVEIQLPAPRTAATRLEETIKTALGDPRRSVPLEQLARRMRTELRADAGRCWLLADAGEHHDSADLAAHLGAIFASQLGDVLLIDGSLDCALLSAGMNAIDRPGLAQAGVSGANAWQSLIQPTAWQHLFLLPAGQLVGSMPDPTAAWTNLLSQAERRFRLVLVDGGPAADPTCKALGRLCDATYLVIRLGVTEARQARQAMQQLRTGGARVIGSIATSVPTL